MEVLHIDSFVWGCLSLSSEEKSFLNRVLFHRDVLNGISEDDGLDHSHLCIAIQNLFCPDVHKLDSLPGDEVYGFVYMIDLMHLHLPPLWVSQLLPINNLQQKQKFETRPEVLLDLSASLLLMGVA